MNRIFLFLTISVVGWGVFNYLADAATALNLEFTRLTFIFGIFIAVSLYLTTAIFIDVKNAVLHKLFLLTSVLVACLSATPLLVETVTKKSSFGVELELGVGVYAYMAFMFLALATIIYLFVKALRNTKDILRKNQIKLLLTAFVSYGLLANVINLVIPQITESWVASQYGPLSTVFLVGFTSYAIVRYRFLDIRPIIARTFGYILLLLTLGVLYAITIFSITNLFDVGDSAANGVQLYNIVVALALAATFQPLKRFFDKLTNRIFYRDAYDSQILINNLNEILVSTLDMKTMLKEATELLQSTLKTEYCTVGVKEIRHTKQTIVGTKNIDFKDKDINKVRGITPTLGKKVIVTDFLEGHSELKKYLERYDIAVLSRMTSNTRKKNKEGLGYVLLGPKKSGNIFSKQDLEVIDIVADELLIAIQNALRFEEIKSFSETLQHRVHDATKELQTKNKKLRELDKAKDDFISMASHQLRTPLTTVKGYLSMLNDGDFGKISKKQQRILGLAYNSSERMVYLIADLLNVSRINTGKFVIDKTEVDLLKVIKSEVDQLQRNADAHNVKLKTKLPKTAPKVLLDESKIRQVMMNFIDNAIYYTPDGGTITVKLNVTKDALEFTVTDTGIGVPKDEQEHMFTKFYRARNARKARPDGTGLGLYLAKKVVSAQGGSIIFKSKENQGSTFGFRFSLAALGAKSSKKTTKKSK